MAYYTRMIDTLSKYEGKRVTLLWSGGLDSTALLLGLLLVGAKVTAIDFIANNLPNIDMELAARREIAEYLETNTSKYPGTCSFRTISVNGFIGSVDGLFQYTQAAWWMSILPMVSTVRTDYVMLGWVTGDSAIAWHSEYQNLWKALAKLAKPEVIFPELVVPFAKIDKVYIPHIFKNHYKLIGKIWWCETPKKAKVRNSDIEQTVPCGECPSCCTMKAKLHFDQFSNEYISQHVPEAVMQSASV